MRSQTPLRGTCPRYCALIGLASLFAVTPKIVPRRSVQRHAGVGLIKEPGSDGPVIKDMVIEPVIDVACNHGANRAAS